MSFDGCREWLNVKLWKTVEEKSCVKVFRGGFVSTMNVNSSRCWSKLKQCTVIKKYLVMEKHLEVDKPPKIEVCLTWTTSEDCTGERPEIYIIEEGTNGSSQAITVGPQHLDFTPRFLCVTIFREMRHRIDNPKWQSGPWCWFDPVLIRAAAMTGIHSRIRAFALYG